MWEQTHCKQPKRVLSQILDTADNLDQSQRKDSQHSFLFSCHDHLRVLAWLGHLSSSVSHQCPVSLNSKCQRGGISVTTICHRVGSLPSFHRTEKLSSSLSRLLVEGDCCPSYLQSSKVAPSLTWIRVPTMSTNTHNHCSCVCQVPNQP